MPLNDLRDWIAALDAKGELARVKEPVSCKLEITAIADAAVKAGGPALLFENVVETPDIPVLINAYASEKRMAEAIGSESFSGLESRVREWVDLLDEQPQGFIDKIKMLPKLNQVAKFFPKSVKSGPCQENVLKGEQVDLGKFPVLTCWPGDGGPFFTLPCVFTHDPETGIRNCGMYRMQVFDRNTTGMHWHIHKHGRAHFDLYAKAGGRMPISVAVGCDPAVTFSAAFPLPDGFDEMLTAGFLRGRPVEMVECITSDVEVPATAEIVLEGYVDPSERRREGPFGDHTGFYSIEDDYPVFHVTCVTHRSQPVYHATVVGKPVMEDCWIGRAVAHLLKPVLQRMMPEIVDIYLPFEGVFHNLMFISIDKRYAGHARKIMHAVWGFGQAMFTKVLVVVDKEVDLRDIPTLAWKVLNHIDPQRDFEFAMGPIDVLDHASRAPGYGSKVGIDATRKLPEEGFTREWPEEIRMDAEVLEKVGPILRAIGIKGDNR
ncbi:MAG: menaquinone biosynthesis decarboxylase [Planctomycetota bacterium]|nr:MAG: menaquinone biosynthesis decarboxylase [Planctomycetota bacterium]